MSKSALSSKVFCVYLFVVGPVLVIAPNVLLALFGMPPSTEVWIHRIGVLAIALGVYGWVGADHRLMLQASVYVRAMFFAACLTFAAMGLASPMIVVFGLIDLLGGLWTHFALSADARANRPVAGLLPVVAGRR